MLSGARGGGARPSGVAAAHFSPAGDICGHTADIDAGVLPADCRGRHTEDTSSGTRCPSSRSSTWPSSLTRSPAPYRYRRLNSARWIAKEAGYDGAAYPWQSGSNGAELTPTIHLNPRSGRWIPDNSRLQRHINAAIAYDIWLYHQATNDVEFLAFYGAEMFIEIARFWASIAVSTRPAIGT